MSTSRFFRIAGGKIIVEKLANGDWIRHDPWDGSVPTSIWRVDSPSLVEISTEEAQELLRAQS